ncbi:MAG: ComEC/Rec2 family competence protein [Inquilinaceae bacterium]
MATAAWVRFGRWLAASMAADRSIWPLWLPVAGGAGIAAYFALPVEPEPWAGAGAAAVFAFLLLLAWGRPAMPLVLAMLLAGSVGFAAAQVRTAWVTVPMLDREIGPVLVAGRVVAQDVTAAGARVVLEVGRIEPAPPGIALERVRIRLTRRTPPPPTGAEITVRAVLNGPSGPVAPGAFDFRRQIFFQRIGAIGYAVSVAEIAEAPSSGGLGLALALRLEHLRQSVAARIAARLDGDTGAVATALLTGERGLIADPVYAAMRDSGLAHLLAISGLHVGLIAGLVFVLARAVLALSQPLALHRPIKKWAALLALVAALAYMMMVGAPVPTQRAALMTGLVLVAILVDRTALSMRLVAWAATLVLLLAPESLLGPSFQMSFAAVVALIASYEALRGRWRVWRAGAGPLRRLGLYFVAVALTSLIASLATGPYALFHFQRIATYGLAANLLAVPLTAFWIMPWGLATYIALPFGAEGLTLAPMGWGIDVLLAIARTTAAWPGAAWTVPAMPLWGLGALTLGGIWLCLWQGRWRLIGVAGIALGLASVIAVSQPDILVAGDGRLMAVRTQDGALTLSTLRRDRFTREIWLRRDGRVTAEAWPSVGESADKTLRCDPLGCLYRRDGWTIAFVRDGRAMDEDCAAADIVVAAIPLPRRCRAALVVDRFDLWREGAHAITLEPHGFEAISVADRVGDRPWTLRRGGQ